VQALGITDAAVLVSSHQSPLPLALLLRWAGVTRIAAVSHDHAGSLLDVRIPGDPDVHEVRRGLLVTEALGFPSPEDDRLRVRLRPRHGDPEIRPPYVVVHPGASVPARTLAPAAWAGVVANLAAAGRRVVVTGGRDEVGLAAGVAGDHPRVSDLAGRLDFRQLGLVLEGAAAVVCGNTGPAHLAAAVGTPVVAVFPPTVPLARWRPWRVPHVVLGDQRVPCAGCRARTCPRGDHLCVAGVDPAAVRAAVDHLARLPERSPA
jgi:ADP-heptose:LPS heptosyltransferase